VIVNLEKVGLFIKGTFVLKNETERVASLSKPFEQV